MKKDLKFLSVSVYKFPLGDCTLGGLSSKVDKTLLLECAFGPHTSDSMDDGGYGGDYLVIDKGPLGHLRAVPKKLKDSGAWVMSGGNFVYTSDSRFPADYPIPVFDRVEKR